MVIWLLPLTSIVLGSLAEGWHARRSRRINYLTFGPQGAPRAWTRFVPAARVACLALATWAMVQLLLHNDAAAAPDGSRRPVLQHLVLCFDVSPSMQITDAGSRGQQRRAERAAEVLRGIMTRTEMRRTRVTAIPFYSSARPVVVDAADPEVIANILDDLPLEHLFAQGRTNLYSTIEAANAIAEPWPKGSATMVVISDGDTLPPGNMPELTSAYRQSVILGVGDQDRGTPIDGHDSRQDAGALRQFAARLRGKYFDANERHPAPQIVTSLVGPQVRDDAVTAPGKRELAGLSILAATMVLAILNPALALAGTGWKPRLASHRVQTLSS